MTSRLQRAVALGALLALAGCATDEEVSVRTPDPAYVAKADVPMDIQPDVAKAAPPADPAPQPKAPQKQASKSAW